MTSQQSRAWAAGCVLAGALALSACGSEAEVATSRTPTGAPAQTVAPGPSSTLPAGVRGSWKRTMKARDWRHAGRGYPLGTWRFDVDETGAMSVYRPHTDDVDFTTQFAAKGRRLTIEVPICPGQTGRYTWRTTAGALRLTVIDDDGCKAGAALFGGTWTRRS
jgi:hypothetical protein